MSPSGPPVNALAVFVIIDPSADIHPTAIITDADPRSYVRRPKNLPITFIGKDVYIGPRCIIGPGVAIGPDTIIDSASEIKAGSQIGSGCVLRTANVGKDVIVGDDCVLGGTLCAGSIVGDRSRVFGSLIHRQLNPCQSSAEASGEDAPVVGSDSFIGENAIVMADVSPRAYVCAMAQVSKPVPSFHVAFEINKLFHHKDWNGPLSESHIFDVNLRMATTPTKAQRVAAQRLQTLELYLKYRDVDAVAAKLHVRRSVVLSRLNRLELKVPRKRLAKTLEELNGVGKVVAIHQQLQREATSNVYPGARPGRHRVTPAKLLETIELYEQLQSARSVAARQGVAACTVTNRLHRVGLKPRPSGGSPYRPSFQQVNTAARIEHVKQGLKQGMLMQAVHHQIRERG